MVDVTFRPLVSNAQVCGPKLAVIPSTQVLTVLNVSDAVIVPDVPGSQLTSMKPCDFIVPRLCWSMG